MKTDKFLSNFEGQLIRIAQHKTLKNEDKLRLLTRDNMTTIVFCMQIEQPTLCGNRLFWFDKATRSIKILDIEKLKELTYSAMDDEYGFIEFASQLETIKLDHL